MSWANEAASGLVAVRFTICTTPYPWYC